MAAASALGNLADRRALDPLIACLDDKYWNVKASAATALGNLGDKRAIRYLIGTLGENEYGFARLAAATSLSKLGEKKWASIVKGESEDYERLGKSGDRRAIEPLKKALDDKKPNIRIKAVFALGHLAGKHAIETLINAYNNETDTHVKRAIGNTIKKLRGI